MPKSIADQTVPKGNTAFELAPETNWKPMKFASNAGQDLEELWYAGNDSRHCVPDGMEKVQLEPTGIVDDAVTVDPVEDESVHEHEIFF